MLLEMARLTGESCIYAYGYDANSIPTGAIGEERFTGGPKQISNAVLVKFADQNILAFQGTITEFKDVKSSETLQSVIDWLDNFEVLSDTSLGLPGLVHKGFARQLGYLSDSILNVLKALTPAERRKPLILTGHSQGGAIATIATKLLEAKGVTVEETYTFAAPRSGDSEFVKSLATPLTRIEFGCDIVPHVPLSISIAGNLRNSLALLPLPKNGQELMRKLMQNSAVAPNYDSAGTLYYSREYGQPIKKYAAPLRYVGLYVERLLRLPFNINRLIKDHHMANYMEILKTDK